MQTISGDKILGKGGFGVVYEGVWNGIQVAVKRIPLIHEASSKQEENALKNFDHENVIKLFHVEENEEFRWLTKLPTF